MFSIINHWKYYFFVSGLLIATSVVLFFVWGLKPGIDFRGGSLADLQFDRPVVALDISRELLSQGFADVVVQPVDETTVIIKTQPLADENLVHFKEALTQKFGEYKEISFESVGPTISRELVNRAYWQVILVTIGIVLYIAYAFRKISKDTKKGEISSWRLGIATLIALIHDLAITVGAFVVLGRFRGVEIDSLFVTALLTILGFSVHDTIVVFDRIREYLRKYPYKSLLAIIDHSIATTLARSINTSSTIIFVLVVMLLFGGHNIFNFVLALLVGVIVGTYSSIFIASPILHIWQKGKESI